MVLKRPLRCASRNCDVTCLVVFWVVALYVFSCKAAAQQKLVWSVHAFACTRAQVSADKLRLLTMGVYVCTHICRVFGVLLGWVAHTRRGHFRSRLGLLIVAVPSSLRISFVCLLLGFCLFQTLLPVPIV